jgi:hypothetical protein
MVAPADDATSTAREFSSEVAHEFKQLPRLGPDSLPVMDPPCQDRTLGCALGRTFSSPLGLGLVDQLAEFLQVEIAA